MDAPSLDWSRLKVCSSGDFAFEVELLTIFVQHTTDQLLSLKQARASQDFKTLANVAHQLKGSSTSIGALPLEPLLDRLEQFAKVQDPSAIELSIYIALEHAFAAVVTDIEHYCHSIPTMQ